MCGDATDPGDANKLMGRDLADMIYCDPPYNIGINYNEGWDGNKGKYSDGKGMKNDRKQDKDYAGFIGRSIVVAMGQTKPDAHVFYWCDEKYIGLLQKLYEENGLRNDRVCLRIKNNLNATPQYAFNKCYEPCVYGTRGKPYLNKSMTNFTEVLNTDVDPGNQRHDRIGEYFNIWLATRGQTNEYEHPTQKPLSLHERPLKRCTTVGHIVMDTFGGGGSTLLACQQLGRKCRTMELDPIFATVIINRWEDMTGNKAKKI